ncbi:hypothetical protein BP00DRAFT_424681 [Aspergillus indologenus CBS 114.80]|uniref:Uncharacterized protein n=1 Tax=Aspergillus indologenus CBS 114.80 TaxID=1450541 RepID=A0A2V5IFP0_9EURO|nr:hypothetical protein BP00DRAFT_424681 [Aspergillus indologenus CBS 114.80]
MCLSLISSDRRKMQRSPESLFPYYNIEAVGPEVHASGPGQVSVYTRMASCTNV